MTRGLNDESTRYRGLLEAAPHAMVIVNASTAGLSDASRRTLGLPDAETSIEATYLFQANDQVALQPDLQYIVHPASAPHLRNALVIGLRISFSGQYPSGSTDTED